MYEKEIKWLKKAKSSPCDGVDCLYHVEGEDCGGICIKALDAAVKALENQDKYRWHDLRKNPEDLPTDGEPVLVASIGSDVIFCKDGETMEEEMERIFKKIRISDAFYNQDKHEWFGFDGFPLMVTPIAWR